LWYHSPSSPCRSRAKRRTCTASFSNGGGETYLGTVFRYANDVTAASLRRVSRSRARTSRPSADQYMKDGPRVADTKTWAERSEGPPNSPRFLHISWSRFIYFLRDGAAAEAGGNQRKSSARFGRRHPCSHALERAINSVIRGSLTIGVIQGILTGIGFTLFGVPNSILWGVVAALSALMPRYRHFARPYTRRRLPVPYGRADAGARALTLERGRGRTYRQLPSGRA